MAAFRRPQRHLVLNTHVTEWGRDEAEGFIKVLADAATDRILGVHAIGSLASELIAEAVMAMEFGASSEDIARICHAHPSMSEVMREAALAVDKRSLNG